MTMQNRATEITRNLIRCPSVTPEHAGVYDVLKSALQVLGFECHILVFEKPDERPVTNMFATFSQGESEPEPHFCFAGHVDVVPVGDEADWTHPPFAAEIENDILYGRGASDMKGGVAAFIAATEEFLRKNKNFSGRLSLLIAGDEEDPRVAGTKHVLEWLESRNLIPDMCLVGEPTNPDRLGEMIKIGRRGSMTGHLTVHGVQGHAAYPHLADNPVPKMVDLLAVLKTIRFDEGSQFFQATNLEIVSVDVGNPADNVIPAKITAVFNIRFNDLHDSAGINIRVTEALNATRHDYTLDWQISGESFLTAPGALSEIVSTAVKTVTDRNPALTTTGGTSDARFISRYCPVVEFGGIGASMHKVDEHILLSDLGSLALIYKNVLDLVFETK